MTSEKTNNNLSAVLFAKNELRLVDRSIPDVVGDDEVLLEMKKVGICGSDVHYWKLGYIANFVVKAPMVLGHEASGVVVKTGKNVRHLKTGDRVAIEPGVPCRKCNHCKIGRYNLCPDIEFCATPPCDGNLCRYYKHSADFCYKIPDHVTMEEAAMLEPLSVGVHACRRAGITAGDTVLICGAGPIGLVTLLVAKAYGAATVICTDILDRRLKMAKELGADYVLNVLNREENDLVKEIENLLGTQPSRTIECTGAPASARLAMLATEAGGIACFVGCGPPDTNVPLLSTCLKEVDIRGVFRYSNCYPISLALVASGRVNVKPLITHRFKLEETLRAFETASDPSSNSIKVMIDCDQ